MHREANFHDGELQAQRNSNESDVAARNGANVAEHIIRPALPFVRQQKMAYVSSIDSDGRVWASVLFGEPGFMEPSDDATTLSVDLRKVAMLSSDPLWENIRHDSRLGLLLLELQTRKRLKINGEVAREAEKLLVRVTESVPICPRYIQRRTIELPTPGEQGVSSNVSTGPALGQEQCALISRADTFFLASAHATHGADCTHRGGPVGFVVLLDDGKLRIPDYNGNGMFNSAGNVLIDPRAGLVFPDYEARQMLQLTGRAEMLWDQPDPDGITGGTGRFWEFETTRWIQTSLPEALRSEFVDASPFLPKGR
jgi:predicted pyridoxine 5'-phosphate oxidase superfamily flavin-nucleotide-binding protein